MEYCPGIKVSDIEKIEAAGIDRKLLAQRSAESYLYQLCRCVFLSFGSLLDLFLSLSFSAAYAR